MKLLKEIIERSLEISDKELLEKHYPREPYQAKFIVTREKTFLEEYKKTKN